ncbi:MAG TPA: hypothetical protein VL026_03205, partial [Rhizomicrobium sp.]|nr:hypothetical protein [Rhizomicrobium sp.]
MSELITPCENRAFITRQLLATASALALAAYMTSASVARAEDTSRPTVWIELGGQMDYLQGTGSPFTAPFMSLTPVPSPEGADYNVPPGAYDPALFAQNQRLARRAFGLEGKLLFQPEASDWTFSAAVRYGRANTTQQAHEQGPSPYKYFTFGPTKLKLPLYAAEFADAETRASESHMLLDFQVGKDVGLGMFGRNGTSNVGIGVRFAQISAASNSTADARPKVAHVMQYASFYQYKMIAEQQRSFRGIGPSLSWNASAALLGDKDDAELSLDWGFNGAVLFGRQKAHVSHFTSGAHITHKSTQGSVLAHFTYNPLYTPRNAESTRARSVAVPNLGAFAGLSVRYPNAKVSFGYRADFLFGAMDVG